MSEKKRMRMSKHDFNKLGRLPRRKIEGKRKELDDVMFNIKNAMQLAKEQTNGG